MGLGTMIKREGLRIFLFWVKSSGGSVEGLGLG